MPKQQAQVNRDVLIQVLEALEFDGFTPDDLTHRGYTTKAITALRAIPNPVAFLDFHSTDINVFYTGTDDAEHLPPWAQGPHWAGLAAVPTAPGAAHETGCIEVGLQGAIHHHAVLGGGKKRVAAARFHHPDAKGVGGEGDSGCQ